MKTILTIALLLVCLQATAQRSPYYERIRAFTRYQANELQLNEQDIIRLSKVNQKTLPMLFEAETEAELFAVWQVYQARLQAFLKPEQIAQLNRPSKDDEAGSK